MHSRKNKWQLHIYKIQIMHRWVASSWLFTLKKKKKCVPCIILAPFQSPYSLLVAEIRRQTSELFEFAQQCFNTQSSSINSLFSPHSGRKQPQEIWECAASSALNWSKPAGPAGAHACTQPLLLARQDCFPKGQKSLPAEDTVLLLQP